MSKTPILGGYLSVPLDRFTEDALNQVITDLTYTSPYPDEEGNYKVIPMFRLHEDRIDLPSEWVRSQTLHKHLLDIAEVALSTAGTLKANRMPDPNHPRVRDPKAQADFMDAMYATVTEFGNALCYAATGSGKTVVALATAARLGMRTLVLVDKESLRDQWIKEAMEKLGLEREDIGILQRDKIEIEGKQIVIGLLPSLARREYPSWVYESFGTVIVDECHKLSTEFFASVLPLFNATYRIGLSATITRKDGSDVVLYNHLGPIRVKAETKIMPLVMHVMVHRGQPWGNNERTRLASIARDKRRNRTLAEIIKHFYDNNRRIVAVSSSVQHIERVYAICVELGIPEEDMGILSATRAAPSTSKKRKTRRTTLDEQAEAKQAKVCFMVDAFKEGIDVPEWDSLVEMLPFWNANQRCGRVRRYMEGKLLPKGITIRDIDCTFSEEMYRARLADYESCGVQVVE